MITVENISKLRIQSGYPIGQCKQALTACNNDIQKALEFLKELKVDKKYSIPVPITQSTNVNGKIHSYIHHNGKIGVLLELQCDTDFTARTDEFKKLCDDICMQIAANNPECISPEKYYELNQYAIVIQKDILRNKMLKQNKPANMIEQIINNMIIKEIQKKCLTTQPFILDEKNTIGGLINELQKITKENITIVKFVRFELGK